MEIKFPETMMIMLMIMLMTMLIMLLMIMITVVAMTMQRMCADGNRIPPEHRVDDHVADDHDDHDDNCGHDHVENVC